MHHIVFDAWSVRVLLRELRALYDTFSSGNPSPLPELPIQYADFAQWQRSWMDGDVLQDRLAYWRQRLEGAPPVLELPIDRPRPPIQTSRGERRSMTLSKALSRSIKDVSQEQGATSFMTLLAAFTTLLHRYTGQDDVVVGSPVAGRDWAETEGLIGVFINTLVLRTDFSGDPTFRELLGRVKETAIEAYAHQDLPFEKLVEELKPGRDVNHTPLFQVMFNYEDFPDRVNETSNLRIDEFEPDNKVALLDLTLQIVSKDEELLCIFEYNTDLFEEATIKRMLGHFQTLLEGIVADPEQRLSRLPLLTEGERQQLLVEWNDSRTDYPRDKCIHQLFEAQVERTPEAVAVVFEDQQLTYRELNARANRLAHYLRKLGARPETLVGICAERSMEMVVGLLGILKSGGAYVPLDPHYPKERLAFILDETRSPILLTQQRLAEALPQHRAQAVSLDTDWQIIAQEKEENPLGEVTPGNLAYVIYTSGSTGIPKGVMIPHRAVANHIFWMQAEYPLTKADRIAQITPFSFDVSVWEFFAPLLTGARLIMARPRGHQEGAYLFELIAEQNVTILQLVPSALRMLLEEKEIENCNCLRSVFCGGETLPVELQAQFFTRLAADLFNFYGPTEACIDTTAWTCKRKSNQQIIPIGRPIANTQVYLLDAHLQPVPVGIPGELYIGGEGLARGYLNRPELTAEKFIPNRFSSVPGARLYKTGDLARYLPDGNIEFLGRFDNQVKLRGFRIELGEIEAVLGQHPAVQEIVVTGREDRPGDKRLVAYVVPDQEEIKISHLRLFLKRKLPEYMVPSVFMLLDALPLTPNGKVDRQALPAPGTARPELEETFVSPRTPTEEILAGIWAELLGFEQVGIHDNFLELGGHSLLATQIISRVREVLQVELALHYIFETPTVADLAKLIEKDSSEEPSLPLPSIQPISRDGDLPLSFSQERVWFIQQLHPESMAYNFQSALRFKGRLDVGALEQSISEIVLRHEIFRTTFPAKDGQPVQVIHEAKPVNLPIVDLQALPKSECEVEAQRLINEEIQKPFNLLPS